MKSVDPAAGVTQPRLQMEESHKHIEEVAQHLHTSRRDIQNTQGERDMKNAN